jgi:hypothetical protein
VIFFNGVIFCDVWEFFDGKCKFLFGPENLGKNTEICKNFCSKVDIFACLVKNILFGAFLTKNFEFYEKNQTISIICHANKNF